MKNHTKFIMAKMRPPARVKSMNLSQSISTVFIIFCGMLLFTILVHMVSVIYFYRFEILNNLAITVGKFTLVCGLWSSQVYLFVCLSIRILKKLGTYILELYMQQ